MTPAAFNKFCASLPATSLVVQWGGSDVWKVGGKVFAIGGWNKEGAVLGITFKVSPMAFDILSELPGLRPAPYFASRGMKWIQRYGKPGLPAPVLRDHLEESHRLASLGLTKKKQEALGLNQG
jgi:predicted DNA-binding protein (MmcQ/YjbR family)